MFLLTADYSSTPYHKMQGYVQILLFLDRDLCIDTLSYDFTKTFQTEPILLFWIDFFLLGMSPSLFYISLIY